VAGSLLAYHPIVALDSVTLMLRTAGDQMRRHLVTDRLMAQLAGAFGALALLMAAVGVYGVISYAIGGRKSEIGLRMALGASQASVLRMVLRETAVLLAAGIAVGLPCAIAAANLLRGMLAGISPADPLTMAFAMTIIGAATLVAGYVPARRAARVDPTEALRCD
jgi:putative ABC transport system permease protein